MERTCRDQSQESSTASDSDKVHISVSSRTEDYHQQGDGGENQEEGCQRSELQLNTSLETKHRTTSRKQCKKYLKKRLSRRKARSVNYVKEQSNVADVCSGSMTSPQEPAHVRRGSEQPTAAFIAPSTAGKGHVTEEDENDKERQYARNSRRSHLANPTALRDTALSNPGLSLNLTADDDNSPSRDINLASGIRNNSSYSTQLNRLESFLAPFLNNQITTGPRDKFVCPQNEDDMRLLQILRYIKSCDGALDLLWDFILEHAGLLTQQQADISCDTVKPTYADKQYWLGDDLKGGETRQLLCGVMGSTQYTRTWSTGSNTKAEERTDAYSDGDDSNMEKDEKIQIVDTSSDTVSGCPLTPGIDLSSEGQMIIITGDVQKATVLQTGVEENVGDSSLEKVVASETHWTRHEEGQEQQTAKQECPIWQILKKFECPFQWVPDVVINSIPNSTIQENMISYLTEKEKEFSQAKCNVFREVVVFLILVYEKTLEDRWMEAFADLQHCYNLLGTSNLECITTSAETRQEELKLNLVRGNYHFNEIKRRRTNFFYDIDEKGTEKDLLINKGGNENNEITKMSKPPKLIARGQFGSSDAELMVQHSAVDQPMKTEEMTGSEEHCKDGKEDDCSRNKDDKGNANGSVLALIDNEVKDEKIESNLIEVKKYPNVITDCESDRGLHEDMYIGSTSQNASENIPVYLQNKKILQSKKTGSEINGRLIDNKKDENENMYSTQSESEKLDTISEASSRGNTCDPDLNDAVLVSEEIKKKNEGRLNNYVLEAGDIQYDNKAIKDIEKENAAGGESETERQAQRMAALEYVINATLAHIAYFSESYQEAYNLAKCIEHIYDQLGSTGKATVTALRGAILLEYGYTGNKLGLPFLKKALELDPEYWEWNLYCGKVLSRIRQAEKFKGKTPEQEQVILLEKAVQLNPEDASALVHLANTYRGLSYCSHKQDMKAETAKSVIETRHYVRYGGAADWRRNWSQSRQFQQQKDEDHLERWLNPQQIPLSCPSVPLETKQKDYLQLAKEMFLKALEIEPHCPYNNARCAKALWSMPVPYKDKERAKEAILHALTLAPNDSLVNHYVGTFYEYYNDYEKALVCYERATRDGKSNFPAEMDYINLKMKISPKGSYSPVFHLDRLASDYSNPNYRVQILCHRGFYLYKMEKQYFRAIRNICTAIKTDPGSQTLKTFHPWNFYGKGISYNMYDLIEQMAGDYKAMADGFQNKDFIEETLEDIRRLREEN